MQRILYGVSPIGLGHAARAVAIGLKLRERGLEPDFATGGSAVSFLASYGFRVHGVVNEPTPSESGGVMKHAVLWYLRYWLGYRSTRRAMASLMRQLDPELVVGDEEFSSVTLALESGIKNALISDELELGFARGRVASFVEGKVKSWYDDIQQRVPHLLVPDVGEDIGNLHFLTPVVRQVTKTREEVFADLRLPQDARLVLFSASGSGVGRYFAQAAATAFRRAAMEDTLFAVTGLHLPGEVDHIRNLGFVRDNQNLIAAADLVISTAGKSTIDEAQSNGTPVIAIPIKNHAEQERNASALGFTYDDVHRLDAIMPGVIAKRTEPKNYKGAEKVASYLAAMLK